MVFGKRKRLVMTWALNILKARIARATGCEAIGARLPKEHSVLESGYGISHVSIWYGCRVPKDAIYFEVEMGG